MIGAMVKASSRVQTVTFTMATGLTIARMAKALCYLIIKTSTQGTG